MATTKKTAGSKKIRAKSLVNGDTITLEDGTPAVVTNTSSFSQTIERKVNGRVVTAVVKSGTYEGAELTSVLLDTDKIAVARRAADDVGVIEKVKNFFGFGKKKEKPKTIEGDMTMVTINPKGEIMTITGGKK